MCLRPIHLKKREAIVPCGKCPKCISRRVSAWSFRLSQEELISSSAHFVTMTYDTKYVPILNSGELNLCKRDLQLFFKRLRKISHGSTIKYYAVGEYGGRTKRPHYHAIIFNAKSELIIEAWRDPGTKDPIGNLHFGTVTGASVGYTLKYMTKQKPRRKDNDSRQREFSLMSKKLGASYLNDQVRDWHLEDLLNRMYCVTKGGVKLSMPRYYKDKLYTELQREAIASAQRIIANDKQLEKLDKQTAKDFRAEMAAIDAAYDRMYRSSLKTCL